MPRPKEYDNLVEVSIKLEYNMVKELQDKNINISEACRSLLERHVLEDLKNEKFVRKTKFDEIPEDIVEKHGKRFLEKPWFHQGIIKVLYKETGKRFFRRELWDYFKQKFPKTGENPPKWERPKDRGVIIIDKTKY